MIWVRKLLQLLIPRLPCLLLADLTSCLVGSGGDKSMVQDLSSDLGGMLRRAIRHQREHPAQDDPSVITLEIRARSKPGAAGRVLLDLELWYCPRQTTRLPASLRAMEWTRN